MKKKKITNSKKVILIAIIILLLLSFVYVFYKYIGLLNRYSNLLLVVITMIYALITAFYAYSTDKMAKMTSSQMKSDISLSKINLTSCFNRKVNNENNLDIIKKKPLSELIDQEYDFYLKFNIFNKSSCSGSIKKPFLIIKILNFELKIEPLIKDYDFETESIIDNGATVFLRGGDFQVVEVVYKNDQIGNEWTRKMLEYIKVNEVKNEQISYFINYQDNMGQEFTYECELAN